MENTFLEKFRNQIVYYPFFSFTQWIPGINTRLQQLHAFGLAFPF